MGKKKCTVKINFVVNVYNVIRHSPYLDRLYTGTPDMCKGLWP